jgi:hypothetical protein
MKDFCDHGVIILAGLVGQIRGEQFFSEKNPELFALGES